MVHTTLRVYGGSGLYLTPMILTFPTTISPNVQKRVILAEDAEAMLFTRTSP